MNKATNGNGRRREWKIPTFVIEALLVITVTPALVHGILSLNDLPIV
jgi:hypothetical protein